MSCVETLNVACQRGLQELANTIEGEMKAAAMKGKTGRYGTGEAASAVHTEMGATSAFVGGTGGEGTKHLGWLNDGNGGGRIYPKRARALYIQDHNIWRPSVSGYSGTHFVTEIANRHR